MQPIDFQVQQRTAANAEHKGVRSALGVLTRIRRAERERGAAAVAPLIERDARAAALEEAAEAVAGLHGWGVLAGCFRCDLRREETTDAEA